MSRWEMNRIAWALASEADVPLDPFWHRRYTTVAVTPTGAWLQKQLQVTHPTSPRRYIH